MQPCVLLFSVHLTQHFPGGFENGLSRRSDMCQVFATASKDFHAELIFQQANLLTDSGL